jgi:hypothetical protein
MQMFPHESVVETYIDKSGARFTWDGAAHMYVMVTTSDGIPVKPTLNGGVSAAPLTKWEQQEMLGLLRRIGRTLDKLAKNPLTRKYIDE